jgi:hypothetical protein
MKTKMAIALLIAGASLAPIMSYAADDADQDRSHPKAHYYTQVRTHCSTF